MGSASASPRFIILFCSPIIPSLVWWQPTHRISCCFPSEMIQQLRWWITPIPSFSWLLSVSFCFATKTTQKLLLQVSCSFASKTLQQLWWRLLPTSHFSWLSSHFLRELNKLLQQEFAMTFSSYSIHCFLREHSRLQPFHATNPTGWLLISFLSRILRELEHHKPISTKTFWQHFSFVSFWGRSIQSSNIQVDCQLYCFNSIFGGSTSCSKFLPT